MSDLRLVRPILGVGRTGLTHFRTGWDYFRPIVEVVETDLAHFGSD